MRKLTIKTKRVMMYFIEATEELLLNEGIENISIKRIAEKAGYNTATIYNYFTDLEELVLYASINHLKDYLRELKDKISIEMTAIEIYEVIYKVFVKHSFTRPEVFKILFFGKYSYKLGSIIKKYYEIFPDEIKGQLDLTKSMLIEGNIHNRDIPVMKQMIMEGSINKEEAPYIIESIVRVHQSYLENLLEQNIDMSLEEYSEKFFKVFYYLLKKEI